jgi:hypothetical protein
MKRFSIALTALVACVAIGMATVSATAGAAGGDHAAQVAKKKRKGKKKFAATISLSVTIVPATTYSPGSTSFSGAVGSGGPAACRSGRAVTITRNGATVASTTTGSDGSYGTSIPTGQYSETGQFVASTPKIVIKKKGKKVNAHGVKKRKKKKIVCLGATSAPVTA